LFPSVPSLFTAAHSIPDFAAPLFQTNPGETLITILHTNDTHSQIDPLPPNDRLYAGKGGVARRATLVKRIRRQNPNTLLIDAGDVCQGTPYFNFYCGEVEYKAMSAIGYDVGTLGNHEFDNGVKIKNASLYADVEKDFAALYGFVNRDDEDAFEAKLVPSLGKLGFDVDFYGRGFFPPGAYHSEGHQDGMGLCLYLALMRHLYGAEFTFAVLDDVLMSVDAGHRRDVCALMKQEFPNTQFVVTTHDPIWLRHMKSEGLIGSGSAVQFRCWNVDEGPTSWDDRDVWQEIDDDLAKDDVRSAAALLRHYLEYVSGELCHRLRGAVEYRGDARYQLGELLPAAVLRLRKLFKRAKEAASSWNQRELVEQLGARAAAFDEVVNKSKVEEWQVNVVVHFNSWDNLAKGDFTPVAKAFRDLLEAFRCPDCGGFLRVSPEREAIEALRCACGKMNINLCTKSPKEKD